MDRPQKAWEACTQQNLETKNFLNWGGPLVGPKQSLALGGKLKGVQSGLLFRIREPIGYLRLEKWIGGDF